MVVNWKVVAWIFIILFVVETITVAYFFNLGIKTINNKSKCSNEVCFNIRAASFTYEDYTKTCSCYNNNAEIIHQEILT